MFWSVEVEEAVVVAVAEPADVVLRGIVAYELASAETLRSHVQSYKANTGLDVNISLMDLNE